MLPADASSTSWQHRNTHTCTLANPHARTHACTCMYRQTAGLQPIAQSATAWYSHAVMIKSITVAVSKAGSTIPYGSCRLLSAVKPWGRLWMPFKALTAPSQVCYACDMLTHTCIKHYLTLCTDPMCISHTAKSGALLLPLRWWHDTSVTTSMLTLSLPDMTLTCH